MISKETAAARESGSMTFKSAVSDIEKQIEHHISRAYSTSWLAYNWVIM